MEIRVGDITGERNPKIDPHCIISEKETEKKRENVKICASLLSNRKKKKDQVTKSGEVLDQYGSLEPFHNLGNGI